MADIFDELSQDNTPRKKQDIFDEVEAPQSVGQQTADPISEMSGEHDARIAYGVNNDPGVVNDTVVPFLKGAGTALVTNPGQTVEAVGNAALPQLGKGITTLVGGALQFPAVVARGAGVDDGTGMDGYTGASPDLPQARGLSQETYDAATQFGDRMKARQTAGEQDYDKMSKLPDGWDNLSFKQKMEVNPGLWATQTVFSNLPQTAVTAAMTTAGALTGGLPGLMLGAAGSATTLYPTMTTEAYHDLKGAFQEAGIEVPDDVTAKAAMVLGAVNSGLEGAGDLIPGAQIASSGKVGLSAARQLATKSFTGLLIKNMAALSARSAAGEGVEEVLQTLATDAAAYAVSGGQANEFAKEGYGSKLTEAGIGGALTGGMLGSGSGIASTVKQRDTADKTIKAYDTAVANADARAPATVDGETMAAQVDVNPLFLDAGDRYGVNPTLMQKIAGRESGGRVDAKNPNSTASGLFQFVDGTFAAMVQKYGAETGITMDMKNDPQAQATMGALFIRDNQQALSSALGREATDGEVYLAHFLGAGGAKGVLTADPNTPISMLVGEKALAANRSVFFNQDGTAKTAGDLAQWATGKMAGSGPGFASLNRQGALKPYGDSFDLLTSKNRGEADENGVVGEINVDDPSSESFQIKAWMESPDYLAPENQAGQLGAIPALPPGRNPDAWPVPAQQPAPGVRAQQALPAGEPGVNVPAISQAIPMNQAPLQTRVIPSPPPVLGRTQQAIPTQVAGALLPGENPISQPAGPVRGELPQDTTPAYTGNTPAAKSAREGVYPQGPIEQPSTGRLELPMGGKGNLPAKLQGGALGVVPAKAEAAPVETKAPPVEAKPVAPTSTEDLVYAQAKKMADKNGAAPEAFLKGMTDIADAVKNKDVAALSARLTPQNPNSRELFTKLTGKPAKTRTQALQSLQELFPNEWAKHEQDRTSAEEAKAKEAADKAAADRKAEDEDHRDFTKDMKPMARGLALSALRKPIRVQDKTDSVKAHMERLVEKGYRVRDVGGESFLYDPATDRGFTTKSIGRTAMKYAQHLSAQAEEKAVREAEAQKAQEVQTVQEVEAPNASKAEAKPQEATPTENPVAEAPTTEAPTTEAPTTEDAPEQLGLSIGEKIGGSRKDNAEALGPRTPRQTQDDSTPAWRKRFIAMKEINGDKWSLFDKKKNRAIRGSTFASEKEAEDAIPLVAVALKHRAYRQGDGTYAVVRNVTDRKWVVIKGGFESQVKAMEYMAAHPEEIIEKKTSFGEEVLVRPEKVYRQGEVRRKGDAKSQDFMDTFGFRGVEFGEWNNQDERREVLNHAFDGLMDLADLLNIPPKAISLNGDLALAFGARGQGLRGARAHYEMDYGVINLTKMSGAGALAHEWYHALDHYLARQDGKASSEKALDSKGNPVYKAKDTDMLTQGVRYNSRVREELRQAFKGVMDAISTKAETYTKDVALAERRSEATRGELEKSLKRVRDMLTYESTWKKRNAKPATAEDLAAFDALADQLLSGDNLTLEMRHNEGGRSRFGSYRNSNDTLDAISDLLKKVKGTKGFDSKGEGVLDGVSKSVRYYAVVAKELTEARENKSRVRQVKTDFMRESQEIDRGRASDYWSTPHELAARAFSAYVEDRLVEGGNVSAFLSYGSNNKQMQYVLMDIRPFPEGKEREAIGQAFDNLFETMQTKETDKGVALFQRRNSGLRDARTLDAAKEAAQAFVGKEIENESTGLVAVASRTNLEKMTSQSAVAKSTSPKDHARAVANLDTLFEAATLADTHADRRGEPTIAAIHRYVAQMMTDNGEKVSVKMTVKETTSPKQPNPIYSVETVEVEKPALDAPTSGIERVAEFRTTPQAGFNNEVGAEKASVKGMPLRDVKDTIRRLAENWKNAPRIDAVATEDDLPAHLRDSLVSQGVSGGVDALFDARTNTVHVIASMMSSEKAVEEALVHETLRHFGLRSLLGSTHQKTMLQAYLNKGVRDKVKGLLSAKDAQGRPLYSFDLNNPTERALATEEALAHMGRDKEGSQTLWEKIKVAFAKAMRRLGFKFFQGLTNAEVQDLLARAAGRVTEGGKGPSGPGKGRAPSRSTAVAPAFQRTANVDDMTPEEALEFVQGIPAGSVRTIMPEKDLSFIQSALNPADLAKENPFFDSIYRIEKQRREDRQKATTEGLRDFEKVFGLNSEDTSTLADLITSTEDKTLVKTPNLVEMKDEKGRTRRTNGHDMLEANPEHYADLELHLKNTRPELSKTVRDAFLSMRKGLDSAWLRYYSAMINRVGMDPDAIREFRAEIGRLQNYFPHIRYGDFSIVGTENDGTKNKKVVYREHFDPVSPVGPFGMRLALARKKANPRIEELKKDFPNASWTVTENKKISEDLFSTPLDTLATVQLVSAAIDKLRKTPKASMDVVKDLAKFLEVSEDDIEMVHEIMHESVKGSMKDATAQEIANLLKTRGFAAHAIRRAGIPGHETKDIKRVLLDYVQGMSGLLTKMEAAEKFSNALNKADAIKRPAEYKYASDYVTDAMRNKDRLDDGLNNVKALAYLWHLAGSFSSGFVNSLQNITVGMHVMARDVGGTVAASSLFKSSGKAILSSFSVESVKSQVTGRPSKNEVNAGLREDELRLIRELQDDGTTDAQYLNAIRGHVTGTTLSRALNLIGRIGGLAMSMAETLNRKHMILAAYNAAIQGKIRRQEVLDSLGLAKGEKADFETAKAYAKSVTEEAHFDYGSHNQPTWARGKARWVQALLPLQSYVLASVGLYRRLLLNQGADGRKAMAGIVGALTLMGGLGAIPYAPLFMAIANALKTDGDDDLELKIREALPDGPDSRPDLWRDIITYGVFSVAGITLQGSLAMGTLGTDLRKGESLPAAAARSLGGVLFSMAERPGKALDFARRGDWYRAAEAIAPRGITSPMQAFRLHEEGQTSNSGVPINFPGQAGARKLTGSETVAKSLGFNPLNNAKARDVSEALQEVKDARSEKLQNIAAKWAAALHDGDGEALAKLQRQLQEWNQDAMKKGNPALLINGDSLRSALKTRMAGVKTAKTLMPEVNRLRRSYNF